MLRDKYTFKHNTNTIFWLHASLHSAMQTYSNTTNSVCALAFLALKPFVDRIENKGVGDKKVVKISLKRTEAVAFYVACKWGYLDLNNYLIMEIYMAIDRTVTFKKTLAS